MGFAGTSPGNTFTLGGDPFFHNLCNQSQVEECRFGLAFGTSGEGKQILGGVDHSLFKGDLTSVPLSLDEQWYIPGALTANGKTIFENQTMFTDSGTINVSLQASLPSNEDSKRPRD